MEGGEVGEVGTVDVACDVALDAPDDLALGLTLGSASFGVVAWALAVVVVDVCAGAGVDVCAGPGVDA
jgi:hypothetical protein